MALVHRKPAARSNNNSPCCKYQIERVSGGWVDVVDGDPLVSTMIWQCNWVIKRSGCCSGRKCQEGQVDSLVEAGVVVATVGRSCPHKRV
eukprot:scaffold2268_cov188-Alexandrium_tamarense.AAC.12